MAKTYGPYTPVRKAGNLYFVSGQVGINPETKLAPDTIEAQTERVLLNLEAALKREGLDLKDVVKTTVFLADIDDFKRMNEVYEKRFDAPRPARSAVAVKDLPRVAGDTKLLVEIEAVAYKEKS